MLENCKKEWMWRLVHFAGWARLTSICFSLRLPFHFMIEVSEATCFLLLFGIDRWKGIEGSFRMWRSLRRRQDICLIFWLLGLHSSTTFFPLIFVKVLNDRHGSSSYNIGLFALNRILESSKIDSKKLNFCFFLLSGYFLEFFYWKIVFSLSILITSGV